MKEARRNALGYSAVIFDFDYTLADSSRGIIECMNHSLRSLGLPEVGFEAVRRTIGKSLPESFVALAGEEHRGRADEFVRFFTEKADEVVADLTVVYEYTPEVMRRLKDQGLKLGIASTKYRYRITTILDREGFTDLFDVIVGGEDVGSHKPDPESLLVAMEGLGSSVDDTLYVGDSLSDAEAAKRAGLPFAAVLSGVTPRGELESRGARYILDDVRGVLEVLAR
ncbi:MAG TPA: HAD-IA family hydrolase [Patescibacteria group bacterium]|nr:HAD-IA family hydrolase [Patescibacteria group bacterium]